MIKYNGRRLMKNPDCKRTNDGKTCNCLSITMKVDTWLKLQTLKESGFEHIFISSVQDFPEQDGSITNGFDYHCTTDQMKYKCLIFDCDGVLVDSEAISNRVLTRDGRRQLVLTVDE